MSRDVRSGIYIDMESMFDLRQAYLLTQDLTEVEVIQKITSTEFFDRTCDQELGDGTYLEVVESGDIKLLQGMQITYMASVLKAKLHAMMATAQTQGIKISPTLYLNIHPFDFTPKMIERFKDGLFNITDGNCYIELVNFPTSKITVGLIESLDLGYIFTYDYGAFQNGVGQRLMKGEINDVELHCPKIYRYKPDEETESLLSELEKQGYGDQFSVHQITASSVIKLEFHDNLFYSNALLATPYIKGLAEELKERFEERVKETDIPEETIDEYLGEHL